MCSSSYTVTLNAASALGWFSRLPGPQSFVFRTFSPVCSQLWKLSWTCFPRWLCWQTSSTSDTREISYKTSSALLLALKRELCSYFPAGVAREHSGGKKRERTEICGKRRCKIRSKGVISPVVSPISSFYLPVISFARRPYVYEIKNHTWTLQFHPDQPEDEASCVPTARTSAQQLNTTRRAATCRQRRSSVPTSVNLLVPSLVLRFTDKSFPCFVLKLCRSLTLCILLLLLQTQKHLHSELFLLEVKLNLSIMFPFHSHRRVKQEASL